MNAAYEIMCTSIIVKNDKEIFMGRNFDTVNGTTNWLKLFRILSFQ
jgi:hypothetical protein